MTASDQNVSICLSPTGLLKTLQLLSRGSAADLDSLAVALAADSLEFFPALEQAKLTGHFYALAKGTPVLDALSRDMQDTLRATYEHQGKRNLRYLELLASFRDRLSTEGIDFLLLKGLYIGQRFAGGIDRRFMWDADVLVHPHHLDDAIRLAGDLGLLASGVKPSRWLLRVANLHAHEVSRRGEAIDIHWCFRARPGYRIDYDRVWSEACSMEAGDQVFGVLSDEHAVLLAILEIASDIERSRIKLRSLWDAYQILRTLDGSLDWNRFIERRGQEGLQVLAVNMLEFFLYSLDCHADCPGLTQALARYKQVLLIDSAEQARQILARPSKHLANRALYARLQPRPTLAYWIHRVLTIPLRSMLVRAT